MDNEQGSRASSAERSPSAASPGWRSAVGWTVAGVVGYVLVAGTVYLGSVLSERSGTPAWTIFSLLLIIGSLSALIAAPRFVSERVARRMSGAASAVGPLLALAIVVLVFAVADWMQGGVGNFWDPRSLRLVGVQSVKVSIAALGMTLIIISGGIDLSAGTALALCSCVCAVLLDQGFGIAAAMLGAVACGAACGALNGILISLLRLVPFIITLGTMTIFLGIGKTIATDGGTITPPYGSVPEWVEEMVTQFPDPAWIAWPLVPNFGWGVWVSAALAVLTGVLLYRTVLGRYIFAIGSSEPTARLCGLPVARTKVLIYVMAGALIGVGGIVQFARLSKGDATSGLGLELQIIAAVVIGGGSLSGGRGSVIGTLCGAAIMAVINLGCTALGLENQVENILLGVIIIAAVSVDRLRQQRLGAG